jgi:hypothetical protein
LQAAIGAFALLDPPRQRKGDLCLPLQGGFASAVDPLTNSTKRLQQPSLLHWRGIAHKLYDFVVRCIKQIADLGIAFSPDERSVLGQVQFTQQAFYRAARSTVSKSGQKFGIANERLTRLLGLKLSVSAEDSPLPVPLDARCWIRLSSGGFIAHVSLSSSSGGHLLKSETSANPAVSNESTYMSSFSARS